MSQWDPWWVYIFRRYKLSPLWNGFFRRAKNLSALDLDILKCGPSFFFCFQLRIPIPANGQVICPVCIHPGSWKWWRCSFTTCTANLVSKTSTNSVRPSNETWPSMSQTWQFSRVSDPVFCNANRSDQFARWTGQVHSWYSWVLFGH